MVKGNNATFNYSTDRARIAELEAENAALREFVAANDKHESFRETVPIDGYELWIAEWEHLKREAWKARQRLATEFGLPLPEVEVADDASDDEQHYGPVCSLCGASILFAGFDLCTNCERDMLDD